MTLPHRSPANRRTPTIRRRPPAPRLAPALLALLLAGAAPAAAQSGQPGQPGQPPAGISCDGLSVAAVEIRSSPPAALDGAVPVWARPLLRFALQSSRTDPDAITPFVLLEEGDRCSDHLRAESERLLRALTYLAEARVTAVPEGDGTVRLLVETSDDVPLIVGGSLRGGKPRRVLYGNENVMGRGIMLAGEWERGYAYREGFGLHVAHYHAFGRRQTAAASLVRGPLYEEYAVSLGRPFVTTAQNVAWRVGYRRDENYLDFLRPAQDPLSLQVESEVYGASALVRAGGRRRNLLLGLGASHERVEPADAGVVVTDTGFLADPLAGEVGGFPLTSATRLAGIAGARWLRFQPVEGLASPGGGVQDVATGVQLLVSAGWALEDGDDGGGVAIDAREPFAAAELYAGAGWARGLTALALSLEGQRKPEGGWGDVVAAGRLAWYHRTSARRTRMVSAEYSAAWSARRPFRLPLGSWTGGVRGYSGSGAAGGRLAVLRAEERWPAGGIGTAAGFGVAAFGDVGKVWAADVPFGTTTGARASLGAGLLVAVPRRSQSHYRLDVAAPLMRDADAGSWTVRVSRELPFLTFWSEPEALVRARAALPSSGLVAPP